MSLRSWVPIAAATLFLAISCSRHQGGAASPSPAPGASSAETSGSAAPAAAAFPTPATAPGGAVSEIRVIAGISPAQVMTTLGARTGAEATGEGACGTGPAAAVQCADLVVAGLPRNMTSVPQVQVFARRHDEQAFSGPCGESGDGIDCALALKGTPGASLQMVGRKPRLEVKGNGFSLRWRAMNLGPEDCDVKLVVSF